MIKATPRTIFKLGNSLAVTIQKSITKEKNLKVGDLVRVDVAKVEMRDIKESSDQKKLEDQPWTSIGDMQ